MKLRPISLSLILALVLPALSRPSSALAESEFALTSAAISSGATIPAEYSCSGANQSPPLSWSNVPHDVKSFALVMEDPDAPSGTFVHWVVYNLPQSTTLLPAALPTTPTLASGGNQGVNSSGKVGYMGPCPPPGAPHHYVFTVYALDSNVTLKPGVGDVHTLRAEMNGHVKGSAELVGLFSR